MGDLNWTDDQWRKVNEAVNDAFGKASVASTFLPLYGPLSGGTETVRNERLATGRDRDRLTIRLDGDDDDANQRLVNLTVKVELSSEQVADETLPNALLAFRRAANILALEQDRVVFRGLVDGEKETDSVYVVNKKRSLGLVEAAGTLESVKVEGPEDPGLGLNRVGIGVVSAVVTAITKLEENFHSGPFACVLGNKLFEAVQQPSFAFVLPSDRITPLLKGPLLRGGRLEPETGIVVSLGANTVDLVIGTPPTVQFLQRKEDAKFLFRVYTRFALRIRDKRNPPIAGFMAPPEKADEGRTPADTGETEVK